MSEPLASDPRDDALRAMLEARADRVAAPTSREVMAAVREEMRAPREGAAFAVVPIITGRRGTGSLGWWAVALAAVVVVAVAGGRSLSSPPTSTFTPSGSSSASSSLVGSPSPDAAVVTPAPSPAISTTPGRASALTLDGLRSALADGSLDGRIVLVPGALQVTAVPCPSPAGPDCFGIAMVGLENVSMTWDLSLTQSDVPSMHGELAFRIHGQTLVFIGRVDGSLSEPMSPERLAAVTPADVDPLALRVVGGWLLVGGLHTCPFLGPSATPCPGPGPVITDGQPTSDGMATSDVQVHASIAAGAPGIVGGRMVTAGPFLVRLGSGVQVLARYDPATLVSVAPPPVTCAQAPAGATLRCEDAAVAAESVDQGISQVTSVEFTYGWYCGNGAFCPIVNGSNGHVIIRHEDASEDLVVDVESAAGGGVRVVDSGPLASGVPSTAPAGYGDEFVSLATLQAAIRDGSMDGQVVVLQATMEVQVHACAPAPSPVPSGWCAPTFVIDALPGITVHWDPVEGAGGGFATWAVVPSGGAVTVLGRLRAPLDKPVGIENMPGGWPGGGDDLLAVTGWLDPIVPISCPSGACPQQSRLWAHDTSSAGTANPSVGVTIGVPVVGYDTSVTTHGAFLVRMPGAGLTVVAHYDPATVIRVVTAPVTCDTRPAGVAWALGCAAAVDAALRARPADEVPLVTSIEFKHGWYCPPGYFCVLTTWSTDGHVFLREAAPGHDVVVDVQAAKDGSVVVLSMKPLSSPSP